MNILDRITDAVDALRGQTEPLTLGLESKEAMRFSTRSEAYDGLPWAATTGGPWYSTGTWSGSGKTNYAAEVGKLDSSSLVMVCCNWFGTTLPEAPIEVVEADADGGLKTVQDHELVKLLMRPNPYYAGELMWSAFAMDWFIDGNVYWRKIRGGDGITGKVVQLWPIPAFMLKPAWNKDDPTEFISHYNYRVDGKDYPIDPADIVHFRNGIDPCNPREGLSPLKSGLAAIYGDVKAEQMAAGLMKRWGVVPYVISPKNPEDTIDSAKAEEVKSKFIYETTGANAGNPIVMGAAFQVDKLSFTPQEMNLDELRMMPEERIAALLQIPPIVLGLIVGLKNATYSNFEQARQMAYEQMVIPTQRVIAGEINAQLLPEFSTNPKQKARHDLSQVRVLQEDQTDLFTRTALVYKAGIITRARAKMAIGEPVEPEDENVYGTSTGTEQGPDPLDASTVSDAPVKKKSLGEFWREPTALEAMLDLKGMVDTFEAEQASMVKVLTGIRAKLIDEAITEVNKADNGKLHEVVLTAPKDAKKQIKTALAGTYQKGRAQVDDELARQKGSAKRLVSDPEDDSELDDLSDYTLTRTINSVQAIAASIYAGLLVAGLVGDALEQAFRENLNDTSLRDMERAAREVANRAIGMGRAAEQSDRADEIGLYEYSAILDSNTCGVCEPLDGVQAPTEGELPDAPNPDCEGGAQCRCFIIGIAA